MSVVVKLAKCYDKLIQGMVQCNSQLMDEVLSDSFCLVHGNGARQTKKECIDMMERKDIIYHTEKTGHLAITPNGKTAQVLGQTLLDVTSTAHPRQPFNLQQTLTAEEVNGEWKFTKSLCKIL